MLFVNPEEYLAYANFEKEYISGNWHEMQKNLLEILNRDDLDKISKIRTRIYLGAVGYLIGINELNEESSLNSIRHLNKAIEECEKINNLPLMFYAYFWRISNYHSTQNHIEVRKDFENISGIYDQIKLDKNLYTEKMEMYFTLLQSLDETFKAILGNSTTKGYLDKSIELSLKALKMAEKLDDFTIKGTTLNNMVLFLYRMGDLEGAFKYICEMEDLSKTVGNKYFDVIVYNYMISYYTAKGDKNKIYEYFLKRTETYNELAVESLIALNSSNMGDFYLQQNKFDESLEYFNKAIRYFKENGNDKQVAKVAQSIGAVYRSKGELVKALQYLEASYEYLSDKKPEYWWNVLTEIASVYLLIGELDKALEVQEERLNFHKQAEYKPFIAQALQDIGEILWQKGKRTQALEKTLESLELFRKTESHVWIGDVLAKIIFYLTELNEVEQAKNYFKQLEEVNSKIEDKNIYHKCKFSEALIISKSLVERDRIRAEILLEDLLKEELKYSFHIAVILLYTELLITNLQSSGDEKMLLKLHKYSSRLFSLASANKSYILTVEALLLQSKLALVDLELKRAEELKEQALKISDENKLDRLKIMIVQEQETFLSELGAAKQFDVNSPLKSRMDSIDFSKRINGVKKASITQDQVVSSEVSTKLFSIKI